MFSYAQDAPRTDLWQARPRRGRRWSHPSGETWLVRKRVAATKHGMVDSKLLLPSTAAGSSFGVLRRTNHDGSCKLRIDVVGRSTHLLEIVHMHGEKEENVSRGEDSIDATPAETWSRSSPAVCLCYLSAGNRYRRLAGCKSTNCEAVVLRRVSYKHGRRQTTGMNMKI